MFISVCYSLLEFGFGEKNVPGTQNSNLEIVHRSKLNAVKMLAVVVVMFAFSSHFLGFPYTF